MTIIGALKLCRDSEQRVCPVIWRSINPDHWIEFRGHIFVEMGLWQEIPHALRLQHPDEFLGEWEVLP